jgi:hypothetical protein
MRLRNFAAMMVLVFASSSLMAQTDAQKSFDKLKTLVGAWEGKGAEGQTIRVTFRLTGNGSALMSEIAEPENMVTMFHMDGDRLLMTHYCGAGNQPRMRALTSTDGKSIPFEFLDVTGLTKAQPGHMSGLVVTLGDADHHTEAWTFQKQDGKAEMHELFDLHRVK